MISPAGQSPSDPLANARRHRRVKGMTLLEMTVVIMVLISLATILILGAQAWKNGSDRAMCVLNLQNVQKGLRSYSNMYGYDYGGTVAGLQGKIIGSDCFIAQIPICPHQGVYSFKGDLIPIKGSLYMTCSLSDSANHLPNEYAEW